MTLTTTKTNNSRVTYAEQVDTRISPIRLPTLNQQPGGRWLESNLYFRTLID